MPPHGAELRGMDLVVQSPTTEGRFGFMFKSQPPLPASDALLDRLGATMEEQPAADPASSSALKDGNDASNENPNPSLTSGFTFLGQFVDHDITFDTTLLSDQQSDPFATTNFRTPRYDLDAIYGRGPSLDPQFYNPNDRDKFLFVERPYSQITGKLKRPDGVDETKTWDVKPDIVYDVPRTGDPVNAGDPPKGTAMIGDPRNDQTLIILQLHVAMQKFHNRLVDYMRAAGVPRAAVFESARRLARWHYQWIVTHEFLPAIVGTTTANSVYKETSKAPIINLKYYNPTNSTGRPFIPVEFAVAAYRFGHSMIRAEYEVQDGHTVPIFGQDGYEDLRGNRQIPPSLWIDWNYFFEIPGMNTPDDRNMARLIDSQLSLPLFTLPSTVVAPTAGAIVALAERNLLRGKRLGLPAGQDVATAMGIKPLTNAQLGLTEPGWKGKAPLWFYILKESELLGGKKLGPVGGRIVAEVILGLMALDKTSYFNANPSFVPGPNYKMGDFILAADAIDPRARIVTPEEPEDPNAPGEPEAPEDPNAPEEPEEPDAPEAPGAGADTGPAKLPPDELVNPAATAPVESGSLTVPV